MNTRDKINHFVRMVKESGPNYGIDVVPDKIVFELAVNGGIDHATATIEFIDACLRMHVDDWAYRKSASEYQREFAVRKGRVNIWAAVLRYMPTASSALAAQTTTDAGVKP